MRKALYGLLCVVMLCAYSTAFAEGEAKIEDGDLGFSFFLGSVINEEFFVGETDAIARFYGVGVAYHPLSFLSLEPGLFFMKTDYENENKLTGLDDKQDRLLIGGSLGLYYNANLAEGLYVYLGPRLDNARYEEDGDNGDGSKRESREQAMSISAVFGLKYLFNDHFALFADFGVGYFSKNETEKYWNNAGVLTTNSERRTDYVALSRGLLGVVFYL